VRDHKVSYLIRFWGSKAGARAACTFVKPGSVQEGREPAATLNEYASLAVRDSVMAICAATGIGGVT
jgi:hypothetical protein